MFHLRYDHQTEEKPMSTFLLCKKATRWQAAYSLANARCHSVVVINQQCRLRWHALSMFTEVYVFDLSFHYWIKSSLSGD